jgi:hypothetical protein
LAVATIVDRREQAGKLLDNLQIDMQKTRELLDWMPPLRMQPALQETARHYLESLQ